MIHSLDATVPLSMNCLGNRTITDGNSPFNQLGFVIIQNLRFCVEQCIERILLRSTNPMGDTSLKNALEFYILKRYMNNRGPINLFVLETSFNVTLEHKADWNAFVATPVNPNNNPMCVSPGDYLGLNLREDIGILGRGVGTTAGVYNSALETTCFIPGATSRVFEVNIDRLNNLLPVISLEYVSTAITSKYKLGT